MNPPVHTGIVESNWGLLLKTNISSPAPCLRVHIQNSCLNGLHWDHFLQKKLMIESEVSDLTDAGVPLLFGSSMHARPGPSPARRSKSRRSKSNMAEIRETRACCGIGGIGCDKYRVSMSGSLYVSHRITVRITYFVTRENGKEFGPTPWFSITVVFRSDSLAIPLLLL